MNPRGAGIWVGAGLSSVVLHVGVLVGLGWAVKPEQVENQPLPQSQINIQAQKVDRVTAREDTAPAEKLNEATPSAPAATQGIVPQSKAAAVTAPSQSVSAQIPTAAKTVAAPLDPAAVSAVQPVAAPALAAVSARAQPAVSVVASAQPAVSVAAPVQTTAPISAPTESSASLSLPATAVAQAAVRDQSSGAPALPLPAIAGKAALAWSGDDDAAVESTSLAAIQAFMRPGDLDLSDSNIGDVRDSISAILASVPCSRLQTTFIPETGQLELRGHVPEDALRGPVLAALKEQVGGAIPISDQLLILPRPQCGALSGIAGVGLPQSTEQLTNPRVIGADGFAQNYTYFDGQRLELELVAPDYDGFVYVDYFTADGTVIHLQPNTIVPLEFAPAKSPLSVGKDRGDKPALDITISPPFGQEIAAAFAASVPLYDGLRPLQEPVEPYLAFLKEQVAQRRAEDPTFKGEWVYFFISTQDN
jgi:hypothetical protein